MPHLRFFLRAGFLCLLLVAGGGTAAFAEAAPGTLSGTLFGTVTDAGTGESLPGATVRIDGTSLGAATDLDGHYRIPRVPEGDHVVVVSYVGYKTQRVPVTVSPETGPPGEDRRLDVALELDVVEGQEIVITAQAEGQVAAINQQLASNQIVSVVSAARIQELPDANAAESVGRLPGISIQRDAGEGQKVVIRGLSPKYNNVTVNGVKLPATDFNDRSTDLNMVSSDMLAGIEVFKALTPDQDADAIGGAVNFRLRGAPAGLRANAVLQGGYSGLTNEVGPYKTNLMLSNRFLGDRLGVFVQGNLEHADRSSERMNAGFINQARSSQDTSRVLLTENLDLRDRTETRDRYGASLLMDYTLPGGSLQFTNFFNRLDRDYVSRDNTFSTAVVAASYDLREARLQTDVWSTALSGEFALPGSATLTFNLNRASSLLDKPYDSRMRFTQNSAFDTGNLVRDQGPQVVPGFVERSLDDTFFDRSDFFVQRMEERDLGAQADLQVPFQFGSALSGHVKFGGKVRNKTRENDNTQYWLHLFYGGVNGGLDELAAVFPDAVRTTGGLVGLGSFQDTGYGSSAILDDAFEIFFAPDLDLMRLAHDSLFSTMYRAAWSDFQDFSTDETISAGYALTEINLGPRILLLPGVRYEHTRTDYDAYFGKVPSTTTDDDDQSVILRDTSSSQTYGGWFPMVQMRIRPTDWFDVRFAYTRTQSRPDFRFTSPQVRISDNSQLITKGTPDLRPSQAQNFDAYLSIYNNRIGLFSVGGFYKKIDDLVYEADFVLQDQATAAAFGYPGYVGYRVSAPLNLDQPTHVKGVELDWQANLLWLPRPFDGLVVNANYARIFSDTKIQRLSARTVTEPPFYIPQTTYTQYYVGVQMLDQPDHVANVSVGYDKGKFSGRISMLYQEGNVTSYGSNEGNVAYFDTYLRWDAQLSYRLLPTLTLYTQLNNLTNRPDTALQSTARFLQEQEFYGSSVNLGLRYRPF